MNKIYKAVMYGFSITIIAIALVAMCLLFIIALKKLGVSDDCIMLILGSVVAFIISTLFVYATLEEDEY